MYNVGRCQELEVRMRKLVVRLEPIIMAIALPFAYIVGLFLPAGIVASKRLFALWQKRGFHVTPNHYYQPIPDTRELKDELWLKHSELAGIDMNEKGQIELLSSFTANYMREYESLPGNTTGVQHQYYLNNPSFGPIDGAVLHCMIRHFKPKRIWEIGSGYSTYLSAAAVEQNRKSDGVGCELVAIEPYPNDVIRAGFPGLSRLMPVQVQDVPISEFCRLEANDILFIDSSHVLRIGGDVKYEYLEVLPRLAKGVIVHCHDIFLPAEYPKWWVLDNYWFWTEQYLLQAFLTFNRSFEVLWAGHYMHLKHPDRLDAAFDSYQGGKTWPCSFWMRKVN
jgi:hypothetical protein